MGTYWVDPPSSNSDDKGEKGSYKGPLRFSCYTTFTGGVVKDLPLGTSCFFDFRFCKTES